ncbi:hypothetical protein PTKIN_Ptkin05aG0082900 [Pterospermum kingtungense]
MCGIRRAVYSWPVEFARAMTEYKGKSLIAAILKIAWCTSIYHIWKERNKHIHRKDGTTVEHVIEKIIWDVRVRISRYRNIAFDVVNRYLVDSWMLAEFMFIV